MTFEQTAQFHEILRQAYLSLGYELIELPLESVEKRAQFIASFLQEHQGSACSGNGLIAQMYFEKYGISLVKGYYDWRQMTADLNRILGLEEKK